MYFHFIALILKRITLVLMALAGVDPYIKKYP